jgi:hypothetical protein
MTARRRSSGADVLVQALWVVVVQESCLPPTTSGSPGRDKEQKEKMQAGCFVVQASRSKQWTLRGNGESEALADGLGMARRPPFTDPSLHRGGLALGPPLLFGNSEARNPTSETNPKLK